MFTHRGKAVVVLSFALMSCIGVGNGDGMVSEKNFHSKRTIECEPRKMLLDSGEEMGEITVVFDGQQSWLLCNRLQNKIVCNPGEIFIWIKSNKTEAYSHVSNSLTIKKFIPVVSNVKITYVCARLF